MTRILGVHHAQIGIPQGAEEQARAFYCGVLGLNEIRKPKELAARGGLWLQVGALQVHLSAGDGTDRHASRAHLGYEVDDLEALRRRLAAAGTDVADQQPALPGLARIEIRDPFGNRVEFLQRN